MGQVGRATATLVLDGVFAEEATGVEQACRDAGGNPIDCRQQKRATKHEAREKSRDIRMGNE